MLKIEKKEEKKSGYQEVSKPEMMTGPECSQFIIYVREPGTHYRDIRNPVSLNNYNGGYKTENYD